MAAKIISGTEVAAEIRQELKEEVKKVRNLVFTKFHPLCRLCSYSGFSNFCNFFETGKCVYHEAMEESKTLQQQEVATGGSEIRVPEAEAVGNDES